MKVIVKNKQYYKFCLYGFLKNLRFFDAFFILFLREKGLSFTEIGVLYAIREIVINISEIPSGIIADAFGRRNSLLASFLFYIVSFIIFYFSPGFAMFAAAFVTYGIAEAFRSGTHKGMIMDYLAVKGWEKQKIDYYGHTRSWSQMGSAVSALAAGTIVFYGGTYNNIFLYSVVPYLLNFLLLLSYPNYLNKRGVHPKANLWPGMIASVSAFLQALKKPLVLQTVNTTAVHSAFLKAVKDYIQPLIVNIAALLPILTHVDAEKKNGAVIGIIYFFIFMATAQASKAASRFVGKRKNILPFATLMIGFIFGILTGAFYYLQFWVVSLLAFVGIYLIQNIRKPILTGFVSDQVPNANLTSVLSALSLWETIVTAIIAVFVGFLSDRFGIGIALFSVSLALAVFSILLKLVSQKKARNFSNGN